MRRSAGVAAHFLGKTKISRLHRARRPPVMCGASAPSCPLDVMALSHLFRLPFALTAFALLRRATFSDACTDLNTTKCHSGLNKRSATSAALRHWSDGQTNPV